MKWRLAALITVGAPERTTLAWAISPVGSGANFGGHPPGGASSRRPILRPGPRPCLPDGLSPLTPLRHSFCKLVRIILQCGRFVKGNFTKFGFYVNLCTMRSRILTLSIVVACLSLLAPFA